MLCAPEGLPHVAIKWECVCVYLYLNTVYDERNGECRMAEIIFTRDWENTGQRMQ